MGTKPGLGFFFGFDNTPKQLASLVMGSPSVSAPTTYAPPAPPTAANAAAVQASADARQKNLEKQGLGSTILQMGAAAGTTTNSTMGPGGSSLMAPGVQQKNTLLGGG